MNNRCKKIAILGATGSIGVNSLHVAEKLADQFQVAALSTHTNIDLLLEQASKFHPQLAAVAGIEPNSEQRQLFERLGVTLMTGADSPARLAAAADYDLLVNAIVGSAGFLPTMAALQRSKNIALANKETLVMGGELVMRAARDNGCSIIPIDSEHSAIFQCLTGENTRAIEEIILTASGGPFRTWTLDQLCNATVEQALKHPNWSMGSKITIDSATMMNKGLEVIEAKWLFNVPVEKIRVVIHPQSIIHSMVAFHDGSVKAQLGQPDMRVPIQLAMTWPERLGSDFPRLDFCSLQSLTFAEPDPARFRALAIAGAAAKTGGAAPAIMNAANEAAVGLFLEKKIKFLQIAELVDAALQAIPVIIHPSQDELLLADCQARAFVLQQYSSIIK